MIIVIKHPLKHSIRKLDIPNCLRKKKLFRNEGEEGNGEKLWHYMKEMGNKYINVSKTCKDLKFCSGLFSHVWGKIVLPDPNCIYFSLKRKKLNVTGNTAYWSTVLCFWQN